MSILITGGAGYIGSHMVLCLLDAGEDVVIVDDLSTGFEKAVPPAARFYQGDVGDTGLLSRILGDHQIDAVLHFAGSVVVPESVADPLKYYLNNTVKSRALIEQSVRSNVSHFIFSSTAAVYGTPAETPVAEEAVPGPISPYGTSKLMTEWMLRDTAAAHGLRYAALRYFNVAGADPEGRAGQSTRNATHLIKIACQVAAGQRNHMEMFGEDFPTPDGTGIRDYIHVTDLAAAHLDTLRYLRTGGDSLVANAGYGHGFSVREVIAAVERAEGRPLDARAAPRRAGDPAELVADPSRLKDTIGWQPRFDDLDAIVGHALAWEHELVGA